MSGQGQRGAGRASGWPVRIAALLGLMLLAACGPDPEQERICRLALDAVEGGRAVAVTSVEAERSPAVRLAYRVGDREGGILCDFAGSGLDRDKAVMTGVAVDGSEALSPVRLHMLRLWMAMADPRRATEGRVRSRPEVLDPQRDGPVSGLLYAAQLATNGLVVGTIYGLLALGFTLVYGLLGRINFAFGELATLGAFTAFFAGVVSMGTAWPLAVTLVGAILAASALGAVWGVAMERTVFRPLAAARGHAPLVAALGLAIALREYYRLAQGARDLWLPPVLDRRLVLVEGARMDLAIGVGQVWILAVAALLVLATAALYRGTAYGRSYRAASDDPFAAALMGVDLRRVAAATFGVASALAAAGGAIMVLRYGGANFFMGLLLGFKALTAAILGGIGSRAGAVVGGMTIALFEALWTGYFPGGYRDVAVFGILAAVIVLRPQGLFGRPPSIQYRAPDRQLQGERKT